MTKRGGLGAVSFAQMAGAQPAKPPAAPAAKGGADEVVRQTVKLTRRDWERMLDLRKTHRIAFQRAAIAGLNHVLAELGQPPLDMPAGDL